MIFNKKTLIISGVAILLAAIAYALWNKNELLRKAKQWVGVSEQGSNNQRFSSSEMEQKLKAAGWKSGDSWCMAYVKMIFLDTFKKHREYLSKLLNSSTQSSLANILKDQTGRWTITQEPTKKAIVIWTRYQNGKPTAFGHAGIVQKVYSDGSFIAIEGNADNQVKSIHRKLDLTTNNGLRVNKFVLFNA